VIIVVAAFLVLNAASCAQFRAGEARGKKSAGVSLMVDSSVYLSVAGGRNSISVPENASIAVEMLKASEDLLARKGYALSGTNLLSVGAPFEASDKMNVRTVAGVLGSPETVGKPFIVRPDQGDPAVRAGMSELFLWARKADGTAPKSSLDMVPSRSVVLVSCSGSNKQGLPAGGEEGTNLTRFTPGSSAGSDAWSEVSIMLLDSSTGKIAWHARGSLTEFTPEAAAKEVMRLASEMPPAK
jgi:hypothetical protein